MLVNGTTAWDYFDDLVFVAHRPGPLVEADLDAYLDDMVPRKSLKGAVVRASDGAPNPRQRERLHHWFVENKRNCAVLTSSMLARGGVTALRWFGLPIRAYALDDLDAALSFVGVKPTKIEHAGARLQRVIFTADALRAA